MGPAAADTPRLIGRQGPWSALCELFAAAASGHGGLVLLAGPAGVGKTRLASEALAQSGLRVLRAPAAATAATAYGPIVGALRAFLRLAPAGLTADAGLGRYLPVLLPELGSPPAEVDRATLFEAVVDAFATIAQRGPTVVFLDDLQDADHATLELLPYLAAATRELPLLLLGAYRADELRRDHPLRRLRAELRRAGRPRELVLDPLGPAETAALAAQLLGRPVSTALAGVLQARTEGLPLFVEELVAGLQATGRLRLGRGGVWEVAEPGAQLPLPETIRDLVLERAGRLSEAARTALEVASVAGAAVDLEIVAELGGGDDAVAELVASGLLLETGPGTAVFRHALVREALYAEVAWPMRRRLHRQLAERADRAGTTPAALAEHWLAAREPERARQALLQAAEAAAGLHAYRDASGFLQRALELWPADPPPGGGDEARVAALDRLGQCAQLSGDLALAIGAWRQAAAAHRRAGAAGQEAAVQRRLAGACELQGAWDAALAAREDAAEAFAASSQPGEAAAERLAAAAHLRSAARFGSALDLLARAAAEAQQAQRVDLEARILGLEGDVRARQGDFTAGVEQVRQALALALSHNLSGPAAEVYQRLADALEHSGDYRAARQTYLAAADFCQAQGAETTAQLCRACMTVVLRQTGDWDHCCQVCQEVLSSAAASAHARTVALGMLGLVRVQRGDGTRGRSLLLEAARQAAQIELLAMQLLSAWGLALVDELAGDTVSAARAGRELLAHWAQTAERHYAIPVLRWGASFFADVRDETAARACADALAQIVAQTGAAEAIAALGHALGELSLLESQPAQAARAFTEALDRLAALDLPYERAHTLVRAGLALVAADERDRGVEHLVHGYRIAQGLGARPLAGAAARQLSRLGEPVDRRLGRRAAGWLERGGLTLRELEVLRLVADGHTDREIAQRLVLSTRTVEMHVAHCLDKLGCRSRAEATRRAAELRLLGSPSAGENTVAGR